MEDHLTSQHMASRCIMPLLRARRLNTRRACNAHCPACKLPFELTCRIIRMVVQELREGQQGNSTGSWLEVTHVCHYWREVALSDPLLWAPCINDDLGPRSVLAMTARARQTPMSLSFTHSKTPLLTFVLNTHLAQTKILSISTQGHRIDHILKTLLFQAPLLQSLALRTSRPIDAAPVLFSEEHATYDFPRLESLLLKQVFPSWSLPFLGHNITYLEIRNPVYFSGSLVHKFDYIHPRCYPEMLHAIQRMENLRGLILIGVFPQVLHFVENAPLRLPLLDLHTLKFHAPAHLACDFLVRLAIPEDACIVKAWISFVRSPVDAAEIASFFNRMHPFRAADALTVAIKVDFPKLTLGFTLPQNTVDKPPIRLIFFDDRVLAHAVAMLRALPLQALRTLKIDHQRSSWDPDEESWSQAEWNFTLDSFPNLHTLVIESTDFNFWADVVRRALRSPLPNVSSVVLNIVIHHKIAQPHILKAICNSILARKRGGLRQLHILARFPSPVSLSEVLFPEMGSALASIDVQIEPKWLPFSP